MGWKREPPDLCKASLRRPLPWPEFEALYLASGEAAERLRRDEHRGYHTRDRIHWILAQLEIDRPDDCEHVMATVQAVDAALLRWPAPPLPGAAELVRRAAGRYRLAIVSDTGFASGTAQNALFDRDGLLPHFDATVYSMDLGHCKPRIEPYAAALERLGIEAGEALHVGDNEATDVRGALDAGMRAVRVDFKRRGGTTAAEFVARTPAELADYLESQ